MKRILALIFFASLGLPAAAETTPDFGTPPSGSVPILFNDHHVYAHPDALRKGRLVAALIRDGEILVPLRSMFQEMGATVDFESGSDDITVHAKGTVIQLVIGVPKITIDGETRPLDVPPIRYNKEVLVPVRVISEALGAYVSWLPDIRTVAIHFNGVPSGQTSVQMVPTPSPVELATSPPTAGPRPIVPKGPPIPVGPPPNETFIEINDVVDPRVNDAYTPGDHGDALQSFDVRGAIESDIFGANFVVDGEVDRYVYPTVSGVATNLDGSRTFVPQFVAKDYDYNVHLGFELSPQKYYFAIGYVSESSNYGYPRVGGLGVGLEKMPELQHPFSFDGSVFYYPNVSGQSGSALLSYGLLQYRAGITYAFPKYLFLDAGLVGESSHKKAAPDSTTRFGPSLGLGLYF